MVTDPDGPEALSPEATRISPDTVPVAVPDCTVTPPLAPEDGVASMISPPAPIALPPDCNCNKPPVPVEDDEPALRAIDPSEPWSPPPTISEMPPLTPAPIVDPVDNCRAPDSPSFNAVPEATEIVPLERPRAPDPEYDPAPAVVMSSLPLLSALLEPTVNRWCIVCNAMRVSYSTWRSFTSWNFCKANPISGNDKSSIIDTQSGMISAIS
jgi:hypothetical protein